MGEGFFISQANEAVRFGIEGRTVIQHQSGTAGQRSRQPIPHHPAKGSVIKDAVTRFDVAMQLVLFG